MEAEVAVGKSECVVRLSCSRRDPEAATFNQWRLEVQALRAAAHLVNVTLQKCAAQAQLVCLLAFVRVRAPATHSLGACAHRNRQRPLKAVCTCPHQPGARKPPDA